jgi:hypothetical protein
LRTRGGKLRVVADQKCQVESLFLETSLRADRVELAELVVDCRLL